MLTKESIEKFQEIYQQEFRKELSVKEATEQGSDLIRLYKLALSINEGDVSNETKDSQGI